MPERIRSEWRASKWSSLGGDPPPPPKLQRQSAIGGGGFVDADVDGHGDVTVMMARDVLRDSTSTTIEELYATEILENAAIRAALVEKTQTVDALHRRVADLEDQLKRRARTTEAWA